MSILRPRIWTSQPQYPVGIDWSNPLTRGLVHGLLPQDPIFDGLSRCVNAAGVAVNGINTSNYPTIQVPTGLTEATIAVVARRGGTILVPWQTVAGNTDFTPYTAGNNYYAITFASGTTRWLSAASYGTAALTAKPFVAVARGGIASNSHALNINGDQVGSANASFACDGAIKIGVSTIGATYSDVGSEFNLVAFWARRLSDIEVKAFSANPWQLFLPRVT